jgi:dihydropteroate synthase
MGVVNVTPDSFSDGGDCLRAGDARRRAMQLVEEGADIIDIGGESTRPGAESVETDDELARIMPVVTSLVGRVPVPISVDTRRSRVAQMALEAGCHMINDISAARDPEMPYVVRDYHAAIVIMHMKGEPKTMQFDPSYDDVVCEVSDFLTERAIFLKQMGIQDDRIIVDPGIGFGKRFRDNLDLLNSIDAIKALPYPVLVGASRKGFLGELLGAGPGDRLAGSLAVAARCYTAGVDIIRVHDVKETVGVFKVLEAIDHPREHRRDR